MNNLLEKMQWLYQQEFEPDLNFVDDAVSAYFIFHNNGLGTPSLSRSDYQPWFSESRLWSLNKGHALPMLSEFNPDENGLHAALLDLTIWCVANGILKPCEQDGKILKDSRGSI